jgi:hypothetical protein
VLSKDAIELRVYTGVGRLENVLIDHVSSDPYRTARRPRCRTARRPN